jgi:ABC-type Fe3+ transport system permease subunit
MGKMLRTSIILILAAALVAVPCSGVFAKDDVVYKDRDPGAMTADLLLTRPAGLCAIVAGAAVFIVSVPFSLLGGNAGQAWDQLVVSPTEYTFHRPLGDL